MTCIRHKARLGADETTLRRAAQRAIRTDGAPADLAAIERAKAQLIKARSLRDEHAADCTAP